MEADEQREADSPSRQRDSQRHKEADRQRKTDRHKDLIREIQADREIDRQSNRVAGR